MTEQKKQLSWRRSFMESAYLRKQAEAPGRLTVAGLLTQILTQAFKPSNCQACADHCVAVDIEGTCVAGPAPDT